jgi:hypothetical protein
VTDHAVLIATGALLPAMKARLAESGPDVLAFSDAEALRALELITTRRPALVLLERKFASTPRGAALINRIKADPSLVDTQIRIEPYDGIGEPETITVAPATAPPQRRTDEHGEVEAPYVVEPFVELDYRGTRRAPRFRIAGSKDIFVDGNRGSLVDLSALGAQLLTATVLKPNQRVRVSLTDEEGRLRCAATVVWASFEIPKGQSPRYRVGLDFIDPDLAAVEGYIRRNKQG